MEGEGQEEEAERGTSTVIPLLSFPIAHVPVTLALPLGENRRRPRASGRAFCGFFCYLDDARAHSLGLANHIMPQGINPNLHNPQSNSDTGPSGKDSATVAQHYYF